MAIRDDLNKQKEYLRISAAIGRAKKKGKDFSELLAKRKELLEKKIILEKGIKRIKPEKERINIARTRRRKDDWEIYPNCPTCGKEGKRKINCIDCMLKIAATFTTSEKEIKREKRLSEKFAEHLRVNKEGRKKRKTVVYDSDN